jgi:uncharacterized protein (DUF2237 family)
MAKNVYGDDLLPCSLDPITGFFRDGCCNTCGDDHGLHMLCAEMTADFLAYSKAAGNDLSTPRPEYDFPGLQPGDRWCLCVSRWAEALKDGCAPKVRMEATHFGVLEHVNLADLKAHALDPR